MQLFQRVSKLCLQAFYFVLLREIVALMAHQLFAEMCALLCECVETFGAGVWDCFKLGHFVFLVVRFYFASNSSIRTKMQKIEFKYRFAKSNCFLLSGAVLQIFRLTRWQHANYYLTCHPAKPLTDAGWHFLRWAGVTPFWASEKCVSLRKVPHNEVSF